MFIHEMGVQIMWIKDAIWVQMKVSLGRCHSKLNYGCPAVLSSYHHRDVIETKERYTKLKDMMAVKTDGSKKGLKLSIDVIC